MMRGILHDSYVEMVSRRILLIFIIITILASLSAFGLSFIDTPFSVDTLTPNHPYIQGIVSVLDFHFTVLFTFAVFAVAGLFPSMMQKGRADFYLSKPISRHSLFTYRFTSVFMIYGAMVILSGLISYGVFAALTGIYGLFPLWVVFGQLVVFFIWLSVVALGGVLFNSGGIAIMIAFFIWFAQIWLKGYEALKVLDSDILYYIVGGLYYVVPKTSQISEIGMRIATDTPVNDWLPLWSSLLFALGSFWLAMILFRTKDY